jgi:hypothetical protein
MAIALPDGHCHCAENRVGSRVVQVKITVAKTKLSVITTDGYDGEGGLSSHPAGPVPGRQGPPRRDLAGGLAESRDQRVDARKWQARIALVHERKIVDCGERRRASGRQLRLDAGETSRARRSMWPWYVGSQPCPTGASLAVMPVAAEMLVVIVALVE